MDEKTFSHRDEPPKDEERVGERVTIRDVAKQAGVSVSTASKALNERGRMTAETRDRVRQAATQLGFTPNALARALVSQRSFTIGLLTSDTYGRFTLPIAAGLSAALAARGVSVFLCAVGDAQDRIDINLRAMQEKCVDGLIIAGKRIDRRVVRDLPPLGMPVIHVNAASAEGEIGFVPDDIGGARLAVEHLIRLGRRRIAHISGPTNFEAVTLREQGWRLALDDAGLLLPGPASALPGEWSEAYGFAVGQRFFDRPSSERPDAYFCGNDQIARGLIDALSFGGVCVPADVAVVGYDNWELFAAATRPPLTTVDMCLTDLGGAAGLTLLELIDGKPVSPGVRRQPCRLVVRQSCGTGSAGYARPQMGGKPEEERQPIGSSTG